MTGQTGIGPDWALDQPTSYLVNPDSLLTLGEIRRRRTEATSTPVHEFNYESDNSSGQDGG
jgi:hypothetical protein